MVGPEEGIKYHLRYEINVFFMLLFFFCTNTQKFWGSSFSSFRGLRVLGSSSSRHPFFFHQRRKHVSKSFKIFLCSSHTFIGGLVFISWWDLVRMEIDV